MNEPYMLCPGVNSFTEITLTHTEKNIYLFRCHLESVPPIRTSVRMFIKRMDIYSRSLIDDQGFFIRWGGVDNYDGW